MQRCSGNATKRMFPEVCLAGSFFVMTLQCNDTNQAMPQFQFLRIDRIPLQESDTQPDRKSVV